ncbi:MAG TPA: metallophosphoesterase [Tepidisphaeraceae bacterium]
MSAAALLSAGLWPGVLAAQDAVVPEIQFLCVNDLHYVDEGCAPFFKTMIEKMKSAQPDAKLLLVVGDLCDNGMAEQFGGIRDILRTLGAETKVVAGNHDWLNQSDRKAYEEIWPGSLNYTFEYGGWQLVGLDSSDGVKFQDVSALPPTLQWLDETLPKLDHRRPMILFTHFPLGPDVKYRLANADALLDRFKEFNLRGVFNGHFHSFTERPHGDFLITTDKCCSFRKNNHDGTPEKGFFNCRVRDGKLIREFVRVA